MHILMITTFDRTENISYSKASSTLGDYSSRNWRLYNVKHTIVAVFGDYTRRFRRLYSRRLVASVDRA